VVVVKRDFLNEKYEREREKGTERMAFPKPKLLPIIPSHWEL